MRERMGSGGPRGLQILRSGASRVRGGFDSHAFPPILSRSLAALLLLVIGFAPARAQGRAPKPWSPSTRVDSLAVRHALGVHDSLTIVNPDSVRGPRAATPAAPDTGSTRTPWSRQPRFVMLRSLVVPGWGQWANHAHTKAVLVAGGEGWMIGQIVADQHELNRLRDVANAATARGDGPGRETAVLGYNARLDQFIGRQWLLGGVIVYALVDAYVDAHFRNFDIEFRNDPALPGGLPAEPEAPRKGGTGSGGTSRVALRWHF